MDPQAQPYQDQSTVNPQPVEPAAQQLAQQPSPAPEPVAEPRAPVDDSSQQVAGYLQEAKNVLITVSTNPDLDELASAVGATLMLDAMSKHATAVFSGEVPSAMEFLKADETFEDSVDSLRDFIIALDKEKADKLRYKVEDDVVRIFITPYKTNLSEDDLEFSQGDFNVDVVLALGVEKREDLDKAILAHGRILHDATVITINNGNKRSSLGAVDWSDSEASSVAEMLVGLSQILGENLLDTQTSTAFLTGIVAATNRFSNEHTTPKVMNMAAQLMASGANQQLIANNLRHEGLISEDLSSGNGDEPDNSVKKDDDDALEISHGKNKSNIKDEGSDSDKTASKQNKTEEQAKREPKKQVNNKKSSKKEKFNESKDDSKPTDQELEIPNEGEDSTHKKQNQVAKPEAKEEPKPVLSSQAKSSEDKTGDLRAKVEESFSPEAAESENVAQPPEPTPPIVPAPTPIPAPVQSEQQSVPEQTAQPQIAPPAINEVKSEPTLPPLPPTINQPPKITPLHDGRPRDEISTKPTFGGTLNATTSGAEEARAEQMAREKEANNVVLSHESEPNETEDKADAIEAARKAVEDAALGGESAAPAHETDKTPDSSVQAQQAEAANIKANQPEEPDPMQSFMGTHEQGGANPNTLTAQSTPSAAEEPMPFTQMGAPSSASVPQMPPLPPMPGQPAGASGSLPPLPPMPNQPPTPVDPMSAIAQPQINPGFMQDVSRSQNQWTQAGDDLAAKQAEKEASRQEKMEKMTAQYDAAVERNQEIQTAAAAQAQPPTDSATFPLPPPPVL